MAIFFSQVSKKWRSRWGEIGCARPARMDGQRTEVRAGEAVDLGLGSVPKSTENAQCRHCFGLRDFWSLAVQVQLSRTTEFRPR